MASTPGERAAAIARRDTMLRRLSRVRRTVVWATAGLTAGATALVASVTPHKPTARQTASAVGAGAATQPPGAPVRRHHHHRSARPTPAPPAVAPIAPPAPAPVAASAPAPAATSGGS